MTRLNSIKINSQAYMYVILSLHIWVYTLDEQAHFQFLLQLCDLYENDSIFDKFDCCPSGDGLRVATGSYRLQIFPLSPLQKWINQGLWSDTVFNAGSNLFRVFGLVSGSDEATTLESSKHPTKWVRSVFHLIFHMEILHLIKTSWFSCWKAFFTNTSKSFQKFDEFWTARQERYAFHNFYKCEVYLINNWLIWLTPFSQSYRPYCLLILKIIIDPFNHDQVLYVFIRWTINMHRVHAYFEYMYLYIHLYVYMFSTSKL